MTRGRAARGGRRRVHRRDAPQVRREAAAGPPRAGVLPPGGRGRNLRGMGASDLLRTRLHRGGHLDVVVVGHLEVIVIVRRVDRVARHGSVRSRRASRGVWRPRRTCPRRFQNWGHNCPVKEGTLAGTPGPAPPPHSQPLPRAHGRPGVDPAPVPGRRRRRRPKPCRRRPKRPRRLVRRRCRRVEGAPEAAAREETRRERARGSVARAGRHRALGQDRGEALARGGAHGNEGAHAIALGRRGAGRRGRRGRRRRRWERRGRQQTSEGGDRPRDAAPHVRRRDQEHGDAAAVLLRVRAQPRGGRRDGEIPVPRRFASSRGGRLALHRVGAKATSGSSARLGGG